MTDLTLQRATAFVCLLLGAAALYWHAGEDLWNDEIYTLQFFVFKGIGTVLTDYHVPNNHILANVLHWFWLQVTAVPDLGALIDQPWRIRLLPAVLSALTLWWVYRAGHSIGGRTTAWFAVLLLLSGITFQAYTFQVRGYALSMAASAAVAALVLPWAAGRPFTWTHGLALALAASVLLLALPSNLYGWAAALGATILMQVLRGRAGGIGAVGWVAGGLVVGMALALVGYLPVLEQLQSNAYFETGASLQSEHFHKFRLVLTHFFGHRWLLLPILLAGAYFAWRQNAAPRRQLVWLLAMLVLPFLFSAFRGDMPPDRVFLPVLPVFALLLALAVEHSIRRLPARAQLPAGAALVLYSALCYGWGVAQVRTYLRTHLAGTETDHYYPGLNHNYYQHYYRPNAEYDLFRQKFGTDQVLILESTEDHDMPVYLRHKNQAFVPLDAIESYLQRRQTLYVSSYYPTAFLREFSKMPGWRCRYMHDKIRVPRVVVCEPVGE